MAGLEGWGKEAVVCGVGGGEAEETSKSLRTGESGETIGLFLGGCGEAVEDGCYLGRLEHGEELADGEVVAGGDVGERDVASEVVVEDGGEVLRGEV